MTYHLETAAIWAGVIATTAAAWAAFIVSIGAIAYAAMGLFWAGSGLAAWVVG
jgi:hypothetical protein